MIKFTEEECLKLNQHLLERHYQHLNNILSDLGS